MVYCLPDFILKRFSWVYIDSLEVVISYEIVYFHVIMLNRKNGCRVSFVGFCNHSFIVLEFCFIDFSVCVSECVLKLEWGLSHECNVSICSATCFL